MSNKFNYIGTNLAVCIPLIIVNLHSLEFSFYLLFVIILTSITYNDQYTYNGNHL